MEGMSKWLVGSSSSQQDPSFHAAGKLFEGLFGRQFHLRQRAIDGVFDLPRRLGIVGVLVAIGGHPIQNHGMNRAADVSRNVLDQPRDLQACLTVDVAVIRPDFAFDDPQQRRLAGAVSPQQADLLSRFDACRDAVE